jgi:dCMP deaminase
MKQKWVDAFMDTAERFAQLSSAKRLQVGAVVVKDNRIISIGYNGMPAGWTNDCEKRVYTLTQPAEFLDEDGSSYNVVTKDEVIHAEANAIAKLASSNDSGKGAEMFITHAPCIHCAKMIYGAGINKVYYRDTYRDSLGVNFLEKCNVEVQHVKGEKHEDSRK